MLEASNLSKLYGSFAAVRDVSFTVTPGQVLGYLGPNGSGKSTTVKMLVGLIEPSGGRVIFNGRDIRDDLIAYKARIGYVPEEAHLYSYLTGPDYLRLVGRLRGLAEPRLEEKIERFLKEDEISRLLGSSFFRLPSFVFRLLAFSATCWERWRFALL